MQEAENRCIYIRARALVLVEVGGGNRALKLALQVLARHADRDRLPVHDIRLRREHITMQLTFLR